MMEIRPGTYQHYKGDYYKVMGLAKHTETLEQLVIYQALYGNFEMWVRPAQMFTEKVFYESQEVPRFKFIK